MNMKLSKNMKQDIINYLGINPDRRTKDFKYLLILRDMSKIDEILNFLTNDLNIKISKKK